MYITNFLTLGYVIILIILCQHNVSKKGYSYSKVPSVM